MRELPRGVIKQSPEDFVVEELPAYEPSGTGPHLYVRFRKTNRTTDEVVRALARGLGVNARDVGVAGLKDKAAVTTQTISLPAEDPSLEERLSSVALDDVEILDVRRHGNKLRTGHLKGNRFELVVRGVDPARLDEVRRTLDAIGESGVPNAFGEQRFGRDGDNAERARAWLTGKERAPGDPRLRRLHFSALQSSIFNAVLEHRVTLGVWNVPLEGDVLRKEDSGGLFVCTNVQEDRARAARGELSPTGPIVGDRMRQPEGEALELEQRIVTPLIEGIDLRRARALGEGTRRPLRLAVTELSHALVASSVDEASAPERAGSSELGCAIRVRFVLAKGAYATTVLANAFAVMDAGRPRRDRDGPPPGEASDPEQQLPGNEEE